ncbi:alpha/beta hydrolase [Nocardioides marinquilinus]|uniref:alpha/beta hydrolase n=1 Tax=Nocardioides marinquilinus TaxID=1210400 RepID=UPI0031EE29B9
MPELDVCPGGAAPRCDVVTTSVRAAGLAAAASTAETRAHGTPGGWEGVAAGAAGSALATFGRDADVATAALEVAVTALDRYDAEMVDLARRRDDVEADRVGLGRDIDDLARRAAAVEAATGGDVGPAVAADLRDEAALLRRRHVAHEGAVVALEWAVRAAEDRLLAALAHVDTVGEAGAAADDPDRPGPAGPAGPGLPPGGVLDDPDAVHAWWRGLAPEERESLKLHRPELLGALDGLPAADRDDVNRALLEREIDALTALGAAGALTAAQRRRLQNALGARDAVYGRTVTDHETDEPLRPLLLLYDAGAFGGDGRGAVAFGDPDTADHTLVMVPGFGNDLASLPDRTEDALRVLEADGGEHDLAVVTWIGYDAPDLHVDGVGDLVDPGVLGDAGAVADETKARDGGAALVEFVDGLRAADELDPSHLTMLGHSYGSTTAAWSAALGADADDLVLTGSPGAGEGHDTVGDLGLTGDHVFVLAAERDPITWLGGDSPLGLGPDPAQDSFGGTRLDAWDGRRFGPGDLGTAFTENHGSYTDEHSRSLGNVVAVATGEDPTVVEGRDTPARDRLTGWVAGITMQPGVDAVVGGAELAEHLGALRDGGRVVVGSLW